MTRLSAIAAAVLLLVACRGSKVAPVAHPPAPVQPAAPAVAPEQKPAPAEVTWSYTSVGKRDPFRSFLAEVETLQTIVTRCPTPLGRFEVDQLRLVAVVTGLDDPVAMVEAPNGVGYNLRRGTCVGRNGGVVSAVRSGEVVISEWAIRADGSRDKTQTVLRLPKEASLDIEE